ncbi:ankyrin [Annulohypoxylon bovei var. microspora]|nr:ankyrin [Annulohypoxylon bovei var. microspora]
MADPVSISASIAGLMTLADVVFLRLMKYVRSVKNAAKDVEDLAKEINTLGGALHSLSRLAQSFDDEPVDNRSFRIYHIEACNDILARIQKKLKKFDSDSLTKKVIWPFSSMRVKEFLDELTRHKQSVNLALTANSMDLLLRSLAREDDLQKTTSEILANVKKTQEITNRIGHDGQHEKVLKFFLRHNPQQNYAMSLKLRQPRTGLWLLRLPKFQTWLSTVDGKLWLTGIPGAGKTILAGTIIEASLGQCNDSVACAFFFCDYKDERTHSPTHILGALAYQIAIQKEEAYQILEQYHRDLHPDNGLPRDYTISGLERAIGEMIRLFDQVFFIVDGIDECGNLVEDVLETFCSISEDSDNISMALLSRDEPNIRDRLEDNFVCEKVAAHKEDIIEYVTAQIEERIRVGKLHIDDLTLKGKIMDDLVDGAAGMFRWVACQLDHLEQCDSDQECREALKKLPPNLNETYLRILKRIPTTKARLAQLILHFVAFANPPLHIRQLREVVSVPETGGFLEPSGLVRENSIQRLCSSLIRKSNNGDKFEFAHFSVQEFLQNETILQDQFAEFLISKSRCNRLIAIQFLKYLQLENFNHSPVATVDELAYINARHTNNPLYELAAFEWIRYAEDEWADKEIVKLAKGLFDYEKTALFSSWVAQIMIYYTDKLSDANAIQKTITLITHKCLTPLHVACAFSLPTICSYLIKQGADVDQESPIGTPLQCAAGGLLSFQNDDITDMSGYFLSRIDEDYVSPAAETIRLLLKAKVKRFRTASSFSLHKRPLELAIYALSNTHDFSVITLLISEGFSLEETDIDELRYKIMGAIAFRDKYQELNFKSFIMTLNSMINRPGPYRDLCSLAWSIAVNEMLSFTSDLNLIDLSISLSPDMQKQYFIQAVMDGDITAFEKIKKASGLNPSDILDYEDIPLLGLALINPRPGKSTLTMVETLLKTGCSFSQFEKNCNPLVDLKYSWSNMPRGVEKSCIEPLMNICIDHGVTICSQDDKGRNVLHLTCKNPQFLEILLAYESETNVDCALRMVDQDGYTPLSTAVRDGLAESASLFYKRSKGDPETWKSPDPVLQLAARGNCEDTFRDMLNFGVITTEIPNDNLTPLHYIEAKVSLEFVKYLKMIYPNACNVRAKGKLPLEVYLEQVFDHSKNELSLPISVSAEVITALYPIKSQDNERKLWEYFAEDIIPSARSKRHDSGSGSISGSDHRPGPGRSEHNDIIERFCAVVVTKLMQLGCLTSYESVTQRPALLLLLDDSEDGSNRPWPIWPLEGQIVCDIINHTSWWPEIQESPLIVRLLKAAIVDNDNELVTLLCLKGASVHQRVECRSALEIACNKNVRDDLFQILLNHADTERLDELDVADDGLGLIHRLAVPGGAGKIIQLLRRGASPNLRTGIYPNMPALIYHLWRNQVESSIILLKNGADPTCVDKPGFDACLQVAIMKATGTDLLEALYQTVTPVWRVNWQKRYSITYPLQHIIPLRDCNALHIAAVSGHHDYLAFYMKRNIFSDVNMTAHNKVTPLHLAALTGHLPTIMFLHGQGANINARTEFGRLPLHYAVINRCLAAVTTLLNLGSDVTTIDNSGMSPYLYAHQLENQPIIDCFHDKQEQNRSHDDSSISNDVLLLSLRQQFGLTTALQGAVRKGNITLCEKLRQMGCQLDANMPSCNGCSPLLLAVRHEKIDIIKWLLSQKASTLKTSCFSCGLLGPIHKILQSIELIGIVPQFLERYLSDGGSLLSELHNPMYTAVHYENIEGVQILLEHIEQNTKHYANMIRVDQAEAIPILVNRCWSLAEKKSPLHAAIYHDNLEIVDLLLENGASLDALDKDLRTPLHVAVKYTTPEVTRALISHGAELNCHDKKGDTPLKRASYEGRWDLVEILLDAGADLYDRNFDLETALYSSAYGAHDSKLYFEHKRIFARLATLGLDPHHQNIRGVSAIHEAMWADHFASLILNGTYEVQKTAPFPWNYCLLWGDLPWLTTRFAMLRKKIPPNTLRMIANTEPSNGCSPLCMSASGGLLKMMENLLTIGANMEFEGCPDGTALMAACCARRLEPVMFLVRRGAALSYYGSNGFRTALDKSKTSERILKWLLVTRFTDQGKIMESSNNDSSIEPVSVRSWSGFIKAEMVICEHLERRAQQSSKDYWIFLMGERKKLRGKVIPMVDGRRTIRPSKLIPLEPVRIHPDGYEVSKP